MEIQDLDILNLQKDEKKTSEENKDLNVLNLKKQEETMSYNNLEGTGVKPMRIISYILIALGFIYIFVGIILIANSSSYHYEREYLGYAFICASISCFLISPIYKVLATIGEAAQIYKDKNIK